MTAIDINDRLTPENIANLAWRALLDQGGSEP